MPTAYTWILSARRLMGDVAIDPFEEFRYHQINDSFETEWILLTVLIILFLALLAGVIVLAILLSKSKAELHRLKSGAGPYPCGTPAAPGYPGHGGQPGQPAAPAPFRHPGAPVQPGYPGYGMPAGYPDFAAPPTQAPPAYLPPQSAPPAYTPQAAEQPAQQTPATEDGLPPAAP